MLGIYVRLSIEDEESNSIENQIEEAKTYADSNNIVDFKLYNEGEAETSKTALLSTPVLS